MAVTLAELAELRAALLRARDEHPELRRGVGQLLPALEAQLGLPAETGRQDRRAAGETLTGALGGRGARRR